MPRPAVVRPAQSRAVLPAVKPRHSPRLRLAPSCSRARFRVAVAELGVVRRCSLAMKSEPPPLLIAKPCPKQWDVMTGDAKRRFCEHCQRHVHNLSAMSACERQQFVTESAGRECITYELLSDGSMVTPSRWSLRFPTLHRITFSAAAVLALLLPFLFSSCATTRSSAICRTAGEPMPPTTTDK